MYFMANRVLLELVSDDLTLFCPKNLQTANHNLSTREVKIDFYHAICPMKGTPGTNVD
jgi:hypothetical protein